MISSIGGSGPVDDGPPDPQHLSVPPRTVSGEGGRVSLRSTSSTVSSRESHATSATLSVVAAVLNEKANLEPWLQNVGWADRIVVIDHGSEDGSRQWLEQHPQVELIDAPKGEGLIEDIRRLGLDQISQGWILVLDLDERVTDELRQEIEQLIESDRHESGFRIPFRHYLLGSWLRYGGWNDQHLRLFRAGLGDYEPGLIHSEATVEGAIGELSGSVLHFAHPTIHDFLARMNRYTSQSAESLARGEVGGLRKRAMLRQSRWSWFRASASMFWVRYIKDRGFRDGMPGFVVAVLLSAYIFIEQAKAWEVRLEEEA